MQKNLLFLAIFVCTTFADAQTQVDSLKSQLLGLAPNDTLRIDLLNELAFLYSRSNPDSSAAFIEESVESAERLKYEKGLMRAKVLQGNMLTIQGFTEEAASYYLEALSLGASDYPLEFIRIHNNLGELYRRSEQFDSSLTYFRRALSAAAAFLPEARPIIIYSNLGEVFLKKKQLDSAQVYFEKCLQNALLQNDQVGLGYAHYGLAEVNFERSNIRSAIQLQKQAILHRDSANHLRGTAQSYLQLGTYYLASDVDGEAESYLRRSVRISEENNFNDLLKKTYLSLYSLYLKREELLYAGLYLKKYESLSDSIRNVQFSSHIKRIEKSLSADLLEKENDLLRKQNEMQTSKARMRLISLLLVVCIAGLVTVGIYRLRTKERIIRERSEENRYTASLLRLAKSLNATTFTLEHFISNLLVDAQKVIHAHRASFWILESNTNQIKRRGLVEAPDAQKVEPMSFLDYQLPDFFEKFLSQRTVSFSELSKEKKLDEFYRDSFERSGIESLLNAPVHVLGSFYGFLSFSMTRSIIREWTTEEHRYIGSLADLLVSAIERERANQLEKEKASLIEKMKRQNESLKEFNTVISHNLREPLTQMIGLSEILLEDQKKENQTKTLLQYLSKSSKNVDRVVKELSTVLNEVEPEEQDFQKISIDSAIAEATQLLQPEISTQNVTIERELRVDFIRSYKPFLLDVFYHLLSNSIKYSNPDLETKIKITSDIQEGLLIIGISDNGRGMDLQKIGDKIFKMYQRYHLDVEGRGIGLYIVANRLSSLNGTIEVESELKQGTTITLRFPRGHEAAD